MDMKRVTVLIIIALTALSIVTCSQAVQAEATANVTIQPDATNPLTPNPPSASETQTWTIIVLIVSLVAVYVAIVVLIAKKNLASRF